MKIHELIHPERVFLGLCAADRDEALERLARATAEQVGLPFDEVRSSLAERERLGSTSVGSGFAIPHAKLQGLSHLCVTLSRFTDGVDFGAADGAGVRFFFTVLSPPDQPAAHLQTLSQIARVLKRPELRQGLLDAPDAEAVTQVFRQGAQAEGL